MGSRVAIVGAGIAGLGAAWSLHPRHRIRVFEARPRIGGHAHTVRVREDDRRLDLDTGFLVFNRSTYPELTRLFDRLGVESRDTDMSFSVSCEECSLEYGGRGVRGLLARPANLLRPGFLRMIADVVRFNRWGREAVRTDALPGGSLGSFLDRSGYGADFARHYLMPLAAALWSSGPATVRAYPMDSLLRFLHNHRLLAVARRLSWETVAGGSRRYVRVLTRDFRARIHTNTPVRAITRTGGGVRVETGDGSAYFDHVVIATHADQALAMLRDATGRERELLGSWRYAENRVWLHTDPRFLPARSGARSSWNYRLARCVGAAPEVTVSYHLNRLQRLDAREEYVVTLNARRPPSPGRTLRTLTYRHPVFTRESVDGQAELRRASGTDGVHFAGAYHGNGFHEDALASGLRAAAEIGGRTP